MHVWCLYNIRIEFQSSFPYFTIDEVVTERNRLWDKDNHVVNIFRCSISATMFLILSQWNNNIVG